MSSCGYGAAGCVDVLEVDLVRVAEESGFRIPVARMKVAARGGLIGVDRENLRPRKLPDRRLLHDFRRLRREDRVGVIADPLDGIGKRECS